MLWNHIYRPDRHTLLILGLMCSYEFIATHFAHRPTKGMYIIFYLDDDMIYRAIDSLRSLLPTRRDIAIFAEITSIARFCDGFVWLICAYEFIATHFVHRPTKGSGYNIYTCIINCPDDDMIYVAIDSLTISPTHEARYRNHCSIIMSFVWVDIYLTSS